MPAFQHRSTSPHIIEPNTDPSVSTAKHPPRPPPKDPSSALRAQSPSSQSGAHGPLRSYNSQSALSASATGGTSKTRTLAGDDTYLRPPSAYSVASAPGTPSYSGQLHQPRATTYQLQTSSARSSTLGPPIDGPRRTTSPFADPTPPDGAELADALRDSVIIGSDNSHNYSYAINHPSSPSRQQASQLIDLNDDSEHTYRDGYPTTSTYGRQTDPNTNMPSHAYSHSTSGLPNAPSANMAAERNRSAPKPRASLQNPFEADEVDPAELAKSKTRVKFGRAHTR
jgi:hypothetical protein